jgi:replicative DNA helicase
MSLLGAMLLERECIGLTLQIIPRDEAFRFYRPDHRILFETLIDLYDENKPIDIILVEDALRRRGQLEEVGGRDYLLDLVSSVTSAANSEHHARIVRDKSLLRDLIQCCTDVVHTAYGQEDPAVQILDEAEKKLFAVAEQRIARQAVAIREPLDETLKILDVRREGGYTGVPTGFTELDDMLGGMQLGDLIVIAARPSMGKTALGLSILEYIGIVESTPAAFFSLEMSKQQIAQRMLCSHAQVEMQRLRHGKLSDKEITKLRLVAGNMRDYPVFVDDTPGMSVMELRAKARRLKLLHGIKVLFVDYLQLMYDRAAARESRQQEISSISRGLKALGRELEIPIVALAQLNRQVEERTGNRPRMSDLRESGAIEQDADVVILLHREEYYWDKKKRTEASEQFAKIQGKADLIVDKQRNGPTGTVELHFNPQYARFDNAAPGYIGGDDYGGRAYEPEMDAGGSYDAGATGTYERPSPPERDDLEQADDGEAVPF